MKKFLAIFLVLILLFSFAACNKDDDGKTTTTPTNEQSTNGTDNNDPTSEDKSEEKTSAPAFENPNLTEPAGLFSVIDVNDYELKQGKPNTTASSGVTFIAKRYEIKKENANTIPNKISVGSSEMTLGVTTLKDILAQGWTIAGKTDVNQSVEAGKDVNVMIKNGQDKILKIAVKNNTGSAIAASDCVISEAGIIKSIQNTHGWVTFSLGDSVNTDSSYAELVKNFGIPKNVNVAEYYNGNDYSYCKATLIFEQKSGNTTYTVNIGYEDKNGIAELNSFIVEVK